MFAWLFNFGLTRWLVRWLLRYPPQNYVPVARPPFPSIASSNVLDLMTSYRERGEWRLEQWQAGKPFRLAKTEEDNQFSLPF
jgi:hypothetical protein